MQNDPLCLPRVVRSGEQAKDEPVTQTQHATNIFVWLRGFLELVVFTRAERHPDFDDSVSESSDGPIGSLPYWVKCGVPGEGDASGNNAHFEPNSGKRRGSRFHGGSDVAGRSGLGVDGEKRAAGGFYVPDG